MRVFLRWVGCVVSVAAIYFTDSHCPGSLQDTLAWPSSSRSGLGSGSARLILAQTKCKNERGVHKGISLMNFLFFLRWVDLIVSVDENTQTRKDGHSRDARRQSIDNRNIERQITPPSTITTQRQTQNNQNQMQKTCAHNARQYSPTKRREQNRKTFGNTYRSRIGF